MSDSTVPDPWARPYYMPGGGDALLFFVILFSGGTIPELRLDQATRARFGIEANVVEFLDAQTYSRSAQPAVFSNLLDGQIGRLVRENLTAEAADAVRAANLCMTLRFDVPDPPTLAYLRNAVGVVTALLDREDGATVPAAVLDAMALRWRTPENWRTEIFALEGPAPVLNHADILVSEDERDAEGRPTVWVHTRGMRKFGRPDLSVRGVPEGRVPAAVELCNRLIALQAHGSIVPEGQPITLPDWPEGWICRHAGNLDDPDFNNVHITVVPGAAGAAGLTQDK